MRLAEDDRGRVPFALVGIVLLVGSATFVATMAERRTPDSTPATGTAIEKASSATRIAIHQASIQATSEAGNSPLIEPVNTTIGAVFDGPSPFREYLRVRIYLAARDALERVHISEGAVVATSSLPATPNASALRQAKHQVKIEPVGDDKSAGIRVRIQNVTLQASRDGRVIHQRTISPVVVIASPVLALHNRTMQFEKRLNRGPLDGPGLGQRLTAQNYAIAWVRGYAQQSGVPIQNVLGNRHIELVTNGALLREQRRAFGQSDPAGREALLRATVRGGISDILGATGSQGSAWTSHVLNGQPTNDNSSAIPGIVPETSDPTSEVDVGVNRSADVGFSRLIESRGTTSALDSVLDAVYRVDVRLTSTTRTVDDRTWTVGEPPGNNWTLLNTQTSTSVRVEIGNGPTVTVPTGWDRLHSYSRIVTRTRTTVSVWQLDNRTRTSRRHHQKVSAVTIGVLGNPVTNAPGPNAPVDPIYESGGPLDGPNFEDVPSKAISLLIDGRGGPDAVARRVERERENTDVRTIQARRPDALNEWIYADLMELREEVRNVSVTVDRRTVVTGQHPPVGSLTRQLEGGRSTFIDAPPTYGSVAERARVAARAAFLEYVRDDLDERRDRTMIQRTSLDDSLASVDLPSIDRIEQLFAARDETTPNRSNIVVAGVDQTVSISADAGPSYLPLSGVDSSVAPSIGTDKRVYPLVARNVNVFTVPFADVADTVVDNLFERFDPQRVSLRSAALTLRAANRTLEQRNDELLTTQRNTLHGEVKASTDHIVDGLAVSLGGDAPLLSRSERRDAIMAGLETWDEADERALALSNGSAADPIAAAMIGRRRAAKRSEQQRDWLALRTRLELSEALQHEQVRPPQNLVNETAGQTRSVTKTVVKRAVKAGVSNATERAKRRWAGKTLASIPSGLPVTPVPGYWYATINVWHVSVKGTYPQFTLRTQHGMPVSNPEKSVGYTRENQSIYLDVDDDGIAERIGRNTPISFGTETVVLVVVPPYGNGVGDVDGNADERSPGWPRPGPISARFGSPRLTTPKRQQT